MNGAKLTEAGMARSRLGALSTISAARLASAADLLPFGLVATAFARRRLGMRLVIFVAHECRVHCG